MTVPTTLSTFLNPLTDFGFKHLFGAETNKDLLISFLNAVFKGGKKIIDIEYGATEYVGNQQEYRKVIFDLLCTADDGGKFIIEMQREKQEYFIDRCIFYLSRSINQEVSPLKKWQDPLKEIYIIALLDYKLEDSEPGSYLQDIALINKDTGKMFYHKLGLKFLELPRFNKKEEELETELDKWLYSIKNMSTLTQAPVSFQEGVFFKFFKLAELNKLSKRKRAIYESNLKAYSDYENTIDYAKMEAKVEGKLEGSLIIAKNMKQKGFPIDQILEITGLSIVELKNCNKT